MHRRKTFFHIINTIAIVFVIVCFVIAAFHVEKYAQEDCFKRIEEATAQASDMMVKILDDNKEKLTVFADILAANSPNPDEMIKIHMENFCNTQDFSAICIHRADGSTLSYGPHSHEVRDNNFNSEVARLPYIAEIFSESNKPKDNYIYQAVPIVKDNQTIAVLYGYTTLDLLPDYISNSAYGGKCQFYIVDGNTGKFMLDKYHGNLYNIYDGSLGTLTVKDGYSIDNMRDDIKTGKSGYLVFRSQKTDEWYYTYYMPMPINNWSIHMTIDEPTAFANFNKLTGVVSILATIIVSMSIAYITILLIKNNKDRKRNKKDLHRTTYINEIQRTLINAHSNPDFVGQTLRIIARELKCETAFLLTISDKVVSNAYYWPSKDKATVHNLIDRNMQDEFPVIYYCLADGQSVIYDNSEKAYELSDNAEYTFRKLDVRNIVLVPVMDVTGSLKGVLAAVNIHDNSLSSESLECITYDIFMAITNLENHNIIKKMGTMDYLTSVKNRNSYESEIANYAAMESESLWCIYADVNGLHEMNNTQGHKAGDIMLCTVANALKKSFGINHTYRLGGDEFVAFAIDSTRSELKSKKKSIIAELASKNYYVSFGFEEVTKNDAGIYDVETAVLRAEDIMYNDKQKYYEINNISNQRDRRSQ